MKKKSITKGDSYKMVYYALLLCSRRELSAGQEEGMKYIKLGSWQRKLRLLYIYSLILLNGIYVEKNVTKAVNNKENTDALIKYSVIFCKRLEGIPVNKLKTAKELMKIKEKH